MENKGQKLADEIFRETDKDKIALKTKDCMGGYEVTDDLMSERIKNHLMRFLPMMAVLAIGGLALSFVMESIIPVPCTLIAIFAIYFFPKADIMEAVVFHHDVIYKIDQGDVVIEKNGVDIITIKGDTIRKIEEYRNGSITIYANSFPKKTQFGTFVTNYGQFLNALRHVYEIDKRNTNEIKFVVVESGRALLTLTLTMAIVIGTLLGGMIVLMYKGFKKLY